MASRRAGQQWAITLRAKVTKKLKTADSDEVVALAEDVVQTFHDHFWPDNWSSWRNDLIDAVPLYSEAWERIQHLVRLKVGT